MTLGGREGRGVGCLGGGRVSSRVREERRDPVKKKKKEYEQRQKKKHSVKSLVMTAPCYIANCHVLTVVR